MPPTFPSELIADAEALLAALRRRALLLATAESCTGGLLAAVLTEIPGASATFERGFVTYSDAAKIEMLGVDPALLARHGAVSAEAARAMAEGALARSGAHVAVAITGIAGPEGGSAGKPVGLVYVSAARKGGGMVERESRFGAALGRRGVRLVSVREALSLTLGMLARPPP